MFHALVLLLGLACGSSQAPAAAPPAPATAPESASAPSPSPPPPSSSAQMPFDLSIKAFPLGGTIPAVHTCEGANTPPEMAWTAPPAGTASFALIVDDPDAPGRTWVHWLAWNIDPQARALPDPLGKAPVQGTTDFGEIGWGGPCPPPGHGAHRYFFRLYALDVPLDLPAGAHRTQVEKAMAGHVLATAEFMGKFSR